MNTNFRFHPGSLARVERDREVGDAKERGRNAEQSRFARRHVLSDTFHLALDAFERRTIRRWSRGCLPIHMLAEQADAHEPVEHRRFPLDEAFIVQNEGRRAEHEYQNGAQCVHRRDAPRTQVVHREHHCHRDHEGGSWRRRYRPACRR